MRHVSLLPILTLAACTPHAFTPGARSFALDSPMTPEVGQADLQGDVGRIGAVFGPEGADGGLRYRRTVRPGLTAEGEGRVVYLTNEGSGGSRSAVTGRAGIQVQPQGDDALRGSLSAGVGGGVSTTAGDWLSVDLGAALGGGHRLFRPFIAGDLSYNAAVGSKPFTVTEPDDTRTTLELPDTVGLRATAGLELGPRDAAAVLGFSLARMIAVEPDVVGSTDRYDEVVIAIGGGFRVALDK